MLERDHVLADLERRASSGTGSFVLITGEQGIGKSAVISTFAARHNATNRVHVGWCEPHHQLPLAAMLDVADSLGDEVACAADTLIAQGEAPSASALGAMQAAFLAALTTRPCVLVIEDAHLADMATLDLIAYLARRIAATPSTLVTTFRETIGAPLSAVATLVDTLRKTVNIAHHRLAPLSEVAVAALAATRGVDDSGVHAATGGNPFYVTEVLADRHRGAASGSVPESVRRIVLDSLARCSPQTQRLCEAVAVAGALTLRQLHAMGVDTRSVADAINLGVLARHTGDQVRFARALAQRAVYTSLGLIRQRHWHREVLRVLRAQLDPDVASLAFHADKAGDSPSALALAWLAARRASASGAHTDSADFYAVALRHRSAAPDHEVASLLGSYAHACEAAGRHEDAIAARTEAAQRSEARGDAAAASEHLNHLAFAQWLVGRNHSARRSAERACELTHSSRLPQISGEAHLSAAVPAMLTTGSGWSVLEQMQAHRFTTIRPEFATLPRAVAAWTATLRFDPRRALASLHGGDTPWDTNDMSATSTFTHGVEALAYLHVGDWDRAIRTASTLLERTGQLAGCRVLPLVVTALVQARRGSTDSARALLDEALGMVEHPDPLRLGPAYLARIETAWLNDDGRSAQGELRRALEALTGETNPWISGSLACWAARLGIPDAAADILVAPPFRAELDGDHATAAALWDERGCGYEAALSRLHGGAADTDRALATLNALGAHRSADKARARLRDLAGTTSTTPRPSTRQHPFALTRRQAEVLDLIAGGLTDRQIAERLYLSPRTVGKHVAAILVKLGVGDRRSAAHLRATTPDSAAPGESTG